MWYIFFKSVITVLVIYAVITILEKIITAIFLPNPHNDQNIFVVIKVKNQEKNLEGVVRSIIWKNLKISEGAYIPNILIVDKGSDDDTQIISEKLSNDYSFVFYTTEEQFEKMKESFFDQEKK